MKVSTGIGKNQEESIEASENDEYQCDHPIHLQSLLSFAIVSSVHSSGISLNIQCIDLNQATLIESLFMSIVQLSSLSELVKSTKS